MFANAVLAPTDLDGLHLRVRLYSIRDLFVDSHLEQRWVVICRRLNISRPSAKG
jgi:hypothetical protein